MKNTVSKTTVILIILITILINNTFGQLKKGDIPDIPGFVSLKCDLHMHSVFSDGHVWPSQRVIEAVRDGLDVIAITDHIDYERYPENINKDYNQPYEIAKKAAEKNGLIVINGGEISPRVPPYHNNAIFLNDVNKLPVEYMEETKGKFIMKKNIKREELMAPFIEASKQGAFVFYNHPGYSWWDKKDTAIFTSFHKELLDKGILKGIEIVNSGKYHIIAHQIAEKYKLTLLGNSDEHSDIHYRYKDSHRPITLVFARERSEASIKEALIARRTAVYVDDFLIARQKEASALFEASLDVSFEKKIRNGEPILVATISNSSGFTFNIRVKSEYNIERYPLGQMTLNPHEISTFIIKELWKYPDELTLQVEVFNVIISPENYLVTSIILSQSDSTYVNISDNLKVIN
jgi:3',5'-nucleoside bisphosphate phosphatase